MANVEVTPISWRVGPHLQYREYEEITIEERRQRDGSALFGVYQRGNCLARDGEWEWEPTPSSRDDDFIVRCRFASFDEALAAVAHLASPSPTEPRNG